MLEPAPILSEQTNSAVNSSKRSLSDLKNILDGYIRAAGLACKGMIIGGLDIDNQFDHAKAKAYYNPQRRCRVFYVGVGQELNGAKYSATLLITEEYGKPLMGTVLSKGKKIEIKVVSLEEGRDSKIMVHADAVRADGESDYDISNKAIKAECTKLGYYVRVKRSRPPFFIKIGLITSKSGGVESDIIKILADSGLRLDLEKDLRRCASAEEMTRTFKEMDAGAYDAICFFRGGREDLSMAIFRDAELFKAIVNAQTYTASGLCHEQDNPIIEGIVDEARSTPTAFGEMVSQHNASFVESVVLLARDADESFKRAVDKIDKDNASLKRLSDSHFNNCISSIRGSITNQCAGPYNAILKLILGQTHFQSMEIASNYQKTTRDVKNQIRENSLACTQNFMDLGKAVFDSIKQTAQNTTTAEAMIRRKEDRLAADIRFQGEQRLRQATERKNKLMASVFAGIVAGTLAGLYAHSLLLGVGICLVVCCSVAWYLLKGK